FKQYSDYANRYNGKEDLQFALKILLSIIPIGVVGVLFEDQIAECFGGKILLVGIMLLITAALLSFSHFAPKKDGIVTFPKALLIGVAQTIAILPGLSRSGTTISVALLLGVDRARAARFSFLMVLIPIIGGG